MSDLESNVLKTYMDSQEEVKVSEESQCYFGHGKLLLTGEYFVLDGAKAIALPTTLGQAMQVKYSPSFSPKLYWKSFDVNQQLWFEAIFEFWHFDIIGEENENIKTLQSILRQARKQNPHFLRDSVDVHVQTNLGFPLDWGLGSSSTLIYNIAQWAYISPFELLFKTFGGSGYDIACAQSAGPITYSKNTSGPNWSPTVFNPSFSENLYFVYLGRKQDSREGIKHYKEKVSNSNEIVHKLTQITDSILDCNNLKDFELLLSGHEKIISEVLELPMVKDQFFSDYPGVVKSLGAWGGDFILATSELSKQATKEYFAAKGFDVCIGYNELILSPDEKSKESEDHGTVH